MTRALALLLCGALGCGKTVPHGGVPKEPSAAAPEGGAKARVTTVTVATELLPADLDLVVRVDLAKIRTDLGKAAAIELMNEALTQSNVRGAARAILVEADVVWVGLRVEDLEHGDHVMVAERARRATAGSDDDPPGEAADTTGSERAGGEGTGGERTGAGDEAAVRHWKPDPATWKASTTRVPSIRRYVRATATPRAEAARLFTVGDEAVVFVSPVEEHSVERLLLKGPDPERGEPRARGLVSVDLRAPRLSAALARRHRAIGGLIESIERLRATVDLFGDRLELEGTIRCRDEGAARKVHTYLATFTSPNTRFAELLTQVRVERTGASVSVRWSVPQSLVTEMLGAGS